jgi:hypothetical protein
VKDAEETTKDVLLGIVETVKEKTGPSETDRNRIVDLGKERMRENPWKDMKRGKMRDV